jgi:hypothetical protein
MADGGSRETEQRTAPHTPERTTTEARQGVTLGHMRYVLGLSLVLAIAALILAYMFIF